MNTVRAIPLFLLFSWMPAVAFTIVPAQPSAVTSYRMTDLYTLAGGAQMVVSLNPAGVTEAIRGGTQGFLATLRAEFPTWTFNVAGADLTGSFRVQNYYACGTGTPNCGTERGVPGTVNGSFIDITYLPGTGDPTAAGNNLHWIQRVFSNHAAAGGHGVNGDIVDNDSNPGCAVNPYYDCGYFAGETFFVDRPARSDNANDHVWGAELYLVEETAPQTVTIYNGVRWGWLNTSSDIRSFVAPPSSIIFEDPIPTVLPPVVATGIGTGRITWGTAVPESFPSRLEITPSTFTVTPRIGEPFVLGRITYANGTIVAGSGLDSVRLSIETTIDVAALGITGLAVPDSRLTSLINTPNTADPIASADFVSIPPTADLTAVPATFPNFRDLGNNFHVLEESSATASLIGRITEEKINDAMRDGGGLLPPGPDAPPPGVLAPHQHFRLEVLGFGQILEGAGFLTLTAPGRENEILRITDITRTTNDTVRLGFVGAGSGLAVDVDYSENLNTWTNIARDVHGFYEDTNSVRKAKSGGFYRGRLRIR